MFKSFQSLISDGSQVLKKLSINVLMCVHFSDLFHLLHYPSSVMRFQFSARIKSVDKQISKTTDDNLVVELNKKRQVLLDGQQQFRQILQTISLSVHPFSLSQSLPTSSEEVKIGLLKSAALLETIKRACELSDKKKKLTTFNNQLADTAAQIDAWWKWAEDSLKPYTVSCEMRSGLLHVLLPMYYWEQQLKKCRRKKLKSFYQRAWIEAKNQYELHPLKSALESSQWIAWAKWISSLFQRTTSAVEGRNGVLSLVSHFSRGLSKQRLNTLTVIHNFHIQREDHTTAAERLFKTKHDSLLDHLVHHMISFPNPRARKFNNGTTPLYLQIQTS